MLINAQRISHLLNVILKRTATPAHVNELVRTAHHIAVTRLKQLVGSGTLHLQSFPLSVEAIAFDCIAEVFARNGDQCFIELEEYFSSDNALHLLSNEEILQRFRILIFSLLRDGIFRLYRENDPILSKILRNLKIAVKNELRIQEYDRFGIVYLCMCDVYERNDHLPAIDIETLERALSIYVKQTLNAHRFLICVFEFINGQSEHRKTISLLDLAVVFKRILLRHNLSPQTEESDRTVFDTEVIDAVKQSITTAEKELHQRYVVKGKIEEEQFKQYFSAIAEILEDTFILNDGSQQSYYDYLTQKFEGLCSEEYRSGHRSSFEYMVKIAKTIVKKNLKELL